jgi:hypothetical protein
MPALVTASRVYMRHFLYELAQLRQAGVAHAIHILIVSIMQDADARDKRGHDAATRGNPWHATPPTAWKSGR